MPKSCLLFPKLETTMITSRLLEKATLLGHANLKCPSKLVALVSVNWQKHENLRHSHLPQLQEPWPTRLGFWASYIQNLIEERVNQQHTLLTHLLSPLFSNVILLRSHGFLKDASLSIFRVLHTPRPVIVNPRDYEDYSGPIVFLLFHYYRAGARAPPNVYSYLPLPAPYECRTTPLE